MNPAHPISAHRMQRIIDLLLDGDLDQKQISEKLHIATPYGVKAYLTYLRSKRKVHILRWRPRGVNGHSWPVYRWGSGPNAAPPPVKPHAIVLREWRKRQKVTP